MVTNIFKKTAVSLFRAEVKTTIQVPPPPSPPLHHHRHQQDHYHNGHCQNHYHHHHHQSCCYYYCFTLISYFQKHMPQNAATYLYPSLSNSYVSPRRGLNGLPSRSQLDAKALTANAATYWKIKKISK